MSEELAQGVDLKSELAVEDLGMSSLSTLPMTELAEDGTISSDVPLKEVEERQRLVFQNSKVSRRYGTF